MAFNTTAIAAALLLLGAPLLRAQFPNTLVGDRARVAEITGDSALLAARTAWTPSLFPRRLPPDSLLLHLWAPEVHMVWNSAIPYSLNDGVLWAGRGRSIAVTEALAASWISPDFALEIVLAPTLAYSENLPFQIIPDSTPGRSEYASRLHRPGRVSADLPLRFGDRHLLRLDPGQTSLTFRTRRFAAGVSTANELWGPGIRNQLVLSGHAAGIPRFFVNTATPVRTRAGTLNARLFGGALTESAFFDADPSNDIRSLSGILVELRTGFDTNLALGFERVVSRAPEDRGAFATVLAGSLDALLRWEPIRGPEPSNADGLPKQRSDQISAAYGRWSFPGFGFEVYAEYARLDLPRSLEELFAAPHHTGGFTVGFQWASSVGGGRPPYLRLQSEVTYVEQSTVFADRPPPDFYTGRAAPHGFTQRGQVIGAAIGPGASSQFLAVDYLESRWQAGMYAGRIRWENDALYRQDVPTLFMHDVSVLGGLRGGYRGAFSDIAADLALQYRYNYLFQNGIASPGGLPFRTVDVRNLTIQVSITPR